MILALIILGSIYLAVAALFFGALMRWHGSAPGLYWEVFIYLAAALLWFPILVGLLFAAYWFGKDVVEGG